MQTRSGPAPGDRLGDYQLLVQVGAGGMGRVFAARRSGVSGSGPLVAIKTGLGELGGGQEFARLFVDEARIASLIDHPNALPVHELGEQDGVLYLVMEWCDGATLRELLDAAPDHRLPLDVAARVVAEVAAGLHAAHELVGEDGEPLQVVHRDVSPQNVLLWSSGHVKVSDFGVAKARGQLHRPTETGEVKGKLSYMAPEQVTSPRIDRRADVFALGCVLYEATVGQRPYHGGDALTTLYQLLERETVAPRALRGDYPEELERIVLRALAKAPERRFQTAEELRSALEGWLRARRSVVTEGRVAAVLRDHVGELVSRKRRQVAEAIARLDAAPSPASRSASGSAELRRSSTEPPSEVATSAAATLDVRPRPAGRRASGERWAVIGLSLGAVALAAVVVMVAARRGAPAPPVVASAPADVTGRPPASGPPPAPSTPSLALVTVRTEPPDARLQLDDEAALPNPLVRRVPADGSTHVVIATAPGYVPATVRVVFDGDRDVVVRLTPQPAVRAGRALPARPPAPGPSAAASARKGGKVRPLDENNPFGRPP